MRAITWAACLVVASFPAAFGRAHGHDILGNHRDGMLGNNGQEMLRKRVVDSEDYVSYHDKVVQKGMDVDLQDLSEHLSASTRGLRKRATPPAEPSSELVAGEVNEPSHKKKKTMYWPKDEPLNEKDNA